jgi:peptidyl-prolyl cis-trans isomerase C
MHFLRCFTFLFAAASLWAQVPGASPDAVVAEIDGKKITMADVDKMLNFAPQQIVSTFRADPASGVQAWFLMQHLGEEAAAMKLDQQPRWKEQIDAAVSQILVQARINQEFDGFPVPGLVVQEYYEKHLDRYQRSRVSGILIRFKLDQHINGTAEEMRALLEQQMKGAVATRSEEEARTMAADISKRLRAGEKIADLVEKYSEDNDSRVKDGDLGFASTTSTQQPENLRQAALALSKGGVSEPLRVTGGFWVIRVEDRDTSPMRDVAGQIVSEVRQEHLNQWMQGVRTRFETKIINPALLVLPPPGAER